MVKNIDPVKAHWAVVSEHVFFVEAKKTFSDHLGWCLGG